MWFWHAFFAKISHFSFFWHGIRSPNLMEREISLSTILLIRKFFSLSVQDTITHAFFLSPDDEMKKSSLINLNCVATSTMERHASHRSNIRA